eukprot:UN04586
MVDILRNEEGFAMFLKHCQGEMCPEGLLFIVKVAHYKGKVQELQFHTVPQVEIENSVLSKHNDTITIASTTYDTEDDGSYDPLPSTKQDDDYDVQFASQQLPPLSAIVSTEIDSETFAYETNLLAKDWIPISNQLVQPKLLMKNLDHAIKHKHDKHMHFNLQSARSENEDIALEEDIEHEPSRIITMPVIKPELKIDGTSHIFSIEKIHNYGKHLFLKYIDVDGEYCINISHDSRKEILLFFSKPEH